MILYVGPDILLAMTDRLIWLAWFDCVSGGGDDGRIYEDDVYIDGHHGGQHALSPQRAARCG